MKKFLISGAVLVGIGVLARRAASMCANVDWEKRFESMPDNAPPKWMFRNITEIRDNTERILELLERRSVELQEDTVAQPSANAAAARTT